MREFEDALMPLFRKDRAAEAPGAAGFIVIIIIITTTLRDER